MFREISRAGEWYLPSGIQDASGGVARHYRADLQSFSPVSTEITAYAVSALTYLHSLTGKQAYLDGALRSARFLTRSAWNPAARTMPFELGAPALSYFFDCGIIVRGLLSAWRASGESEFLEVASKLGEAMRADFESRAEGFEAVLRLPAKAPLSLDGGRWSVAPGCYQLKAAMAWRDVAAATGNSALGSAYANAVERCAENQQSFLRGFAGSARIVDRLHAYLYFLEGLLPVANKPRFADATRDGIAQVAAIVREMAPQFERADVYAQLLRIRILADAAGISPMDQESSVREAERLAGLQASDEDPRLNGGFYFGRRQGEVIPHVNPASTAFAIQALALWRSTGQGNTAFDSALLV